MAWTVARTWISGELITASMMNLHVRDNLNYLYGLNPTTGVYTSYTPTWGNTGTANVLGAGTITGSYAQFAGKTIHCEIDLILGAGSSVGNGTQYFTLPAPSYSGTAIEAASALVYDSAPSAYYPSCAIKLSGQASQLVVMTSSGALVTATSPFTFASGDQVSINAVYRAA